MILFDLFNLHNQPSFVHITLSINPRFSLKVTSPGASFINMAYAQKMAYATFYANFGMY